MDVNTRFSPQTTLVGHRLSDGLTSPKPARSSRRSEVVLTSQSEHSSSRSAAQQQPLHPEIWQMLADRLPKGKSKEANARRRQLFRQIDTNGNGHLSLAEVDKGIVDALGCRDLLNIKPVLIRAFNAAKNLSGEEVGPFAGYVQFKEFRGLLSYLRQYFEYWVMFDRIDTSSDRRINFQEFQQALGEIQKWGVEVADPVAAFREIDVNGQGMILFDEFANWAISNSLDLEDDDEVEDSVDYAQVKFESLRTTAKQQGFVTPPPRGLLAREQQAEVSSDSKDSLA